MLKAIHYQVKIIQSLLFTAFMQIPTRAPEVRGPVSFFVPSGKISLRGPGHHSTFASKSGKLSKILESILIVACKPLVENSSWT